MFSKNIKVSIGKGDSKKLIAATFEAMEANDVILTDKGLLVVGVNLTSDDRDRIVKLYNYAADLKARASVRAANTDVGQKTKNREAARMFIMTQLGKGDTTYFEQYQQEVAKNNVKELNEYLDDLFENMEA